MHDVVTDNLPTSVQLAVCLSLEISKIINGLYGQTDGRGEISTQQPCKGQGQNTVSREGDKVAASSQI